MMPINFKQEAFSGAYIRAISAVAGCAISKPEPDHDKIDFILSAKLQGSVKTKPKIDIQAKCYLQDNIPAGTHFSYQLDIETYNNLRDDRVSDPRILVVVVAPSSTSGHDWLEQSEDALGLKYCGYWLSLKGMPASANATNQTVSIPKANIFSAAALTDMMQKSSNGVDL